MKKNEIREKKFPSSLILVHAISMNINLFCVFAMRQRQHTDDMQEEPRQTRRKKSVDLDEMMKSKQVEFSNIINTRDEHDRKDKEIHHQLASDEISITIHIVFAQVSNRKLFEREQSDMKMASDMSWKRYPDIKSRTTIASTLREHFHLENFANAKRPPEDVGEET